MPYISMKRVYSMVLALFFALTLALPGIAADAPEPEFSEEMSVPEETEPPEDESEPGETGPPEETNPSEDEPEPEETDPLEETDPSEEDPELEETDPPEETEPPEDESEPEETDPPEETEPSEEDPEPEETAPAEETEPFEEELEPEETDPPEKIEPSEDEPEPEEADPAEEAELFEDGSEPALDCPVIQVAVPQTGQIIINPYGLPVNTVDGISMDQIVGEPLPITNQGGAPVAVLASVVGSIADLSGIVFVSEPPRADAREKEIFLYAEFKDNESFWSGGYVSAENQLLITEQVSETKNVLTLDKGGTGWFQLFGSTAIYPEDNWCADDVFRVTVMFTFTSESTPNPEAPDEPTPTSDPVDSDDQDEPVPTPDSENTYNPISEPTPEETN